MTAVVFGRANARQSGSLPPSSPWPVTKLTLFAYSRCVRGIPAYAAQPFAAEMPGTTEKPMPARASASSS